jgi:hypothetical protein
MRNGEVGMGKSEWGKLKKQLCVRLEVGGLRQKAKSPSNLLNLINSINYYTRNPYLIRSIYSIRNPKSEIPNRETLNLEP